MFHIVEQKSSNAFAMRGIFIYLFLKSLARESDLYIILYTEQKSEYNRENYGSVGNGCSTQTTETIFFYLIKIFFSKKKWSTESTLRNILFESTSSLRFATCLSKQLSSQYFVLIFPTWLKHHLCNSDLRSRIWSWFPGPCSEIQTQSNYHLPVQFACIKSDVETIEKINFSASTACCWVRSPHSSCHSQSTQTADSCQLLPFGPRSAWREGRRDQSR